MHLRFRHGTLSQRCTIALVANDIKHLLELPKQTHVTFTAKTGSRYLGWQRWHKGRNYITINATLHGTQLYTVFLHELMHSLDYEHVRDKAHFMAAYIPTSFATNDAILPTIRRTLIQQLMERQRR